MPIAITASAHDEKGRTLDVLADLIAQRAKWCRKTTQDAAVSIAIAAVTSLRAGTRIARRPAKFSVTLRDELRFAVKSGRPCIVVKGGGEITDHPWRKVENRIDFSRHPRVFIVDNHEHERSKPYYVVAYNAAEAQKFALTLEKRRVERYSPLAKVTLGIAMTKLSTRNAGTADKKLLRNIGSNLVTAKTSIAGDVFTLSVEDALDYAQAALKPGMTVDIALKKAANKIAGIISKAMQRALGDLDAKIPTPFPEVKSRR